MLYQFQQTTLMLLLLFRTSLNQYQLLVDGYHVTSSRWVGLQFAEVRSNRTTILGLVFGVLRSQGSRCINYIR